MSKLKREKLIPIDLKEFRENFKDIIGDFESESTLVKEEVERREEADKRLEESGRTVILNQTPFSNS